MRRLGASGSAIFILGCAIAPTCTKKDRARRAEQAQQRLTNRLSANADQHDDEEVEWGQPYDADIVREADLGCGWPDITDHEMKVDRQPQQPKEPRTERRLIDPELKRQRHQRTRQNRQRRARAAREGGLLQVQEEEEEEG